MPPLSHPSPGVCPGACGSPRFRPAPAGRLQAASSPRRGRLVSWPVDRARMALATTLIAAACFLPAGVAAQYDQAPPPAAWAMANVTVTHADGRTETGMTVVVRGGIIETLRAGVAIPSDARDLSWEEGTLHLYPGFIDAHGATGVDLPTPSRDGVQSWNPTREVQFFTPHREAASFLQANGGSLAAERRRGVVASVVFPGRGPLPGQPSLILHRADARTSGELVLAPSLGLAAAWQGAQGAYPGTLMAQHAFFRQAFLDAEHYQAHREAWTRNPDRMAPVTRDADLEWLLRAAAGEVPVHFQANSVHDIRRVLNLADELGFRPVIVGGAEAGVLAPELARRGVPVLLSASFPQARDWDPASAVAEATEGEEAPGEANGATSRAQDDLSPAAFRERARLEPIYRTAARLAEAGVTFAFTSGGSGNTDLLAGARRAIQFGLDEGAALQALTSVPATIVGVPALARVGEGTAATFLVSDRPLFEEGAGIVWTFVNGHAEKGRDPQAPRPAPGTAEAREGASPGAAGAAGQGGAAAFVGRWTGTLSGPQQLPLEIVFEEGPSGLAGTIALGPAGSSPLRNVEVDGNRIRFLVTLAQFQGVTIPLEGTLDGDRVTGRGTITFGDNPIPLSFDLRRAPGEVVR